MKGFIDDWDALSALFQANQYRQDAQRRADEAKRDLRNAKEIQAELLFRIDQHVADEKNKKKRAAMINEGTCAEGLRGLRESLGMDEFGKKPKDEDDGNADA